MAHKALYRRYYHLCTLDNLASAINFNAKQDTYYCVFGKRGFHCLGMTQANVRAFLTTIARGHAC